MINITRTPAPKPSGPLPVDGSNMKEGIIYRNADVPCQAAGGTDRWARLAHGLYIRFSYDIYGKNEAIYQIGSIGGRFVPCYDEQVSITLGGAE